MAFRLPQLSEGVRRRTRRRIAKEELLEKARAAEVPKVREPLGRVVGELHIDGVGAAACHLVMRVPSCIIFAVDGRAVAARAQLRMTFRLQKSAIVIRETARLRARGYRREMAAYVIAVCRRCTVRF